MNIDLIDFLGGDRGDEPGQGMTVDLFEETFARFRR